MEVDAGSESEKVVENVMGENPETVLLSDNEGAGDGGTTEAIGDDSEGNTSTQVNDEQDNKEEEGQEIDSAAAEPSDLTKNKAVDVSVDQGNEPDVPENGEKDVEDSTKESDENASEVNAQAQNQDVTGDEGEDNEDSAPAETDSANVVLDTPDDNEDVQETTEGAEQHDPRDTSVVDEDAEDETAPPTEPSVLELEKEEEDSAEIECIDISEDDVPRLSTLIDDSNDGAKDQEANGDSEEQDELEEELVEMLAKKDVFLYNIPLDDKSQSRKASEWNLSEPMWCGNLQLLSQGSKCIIKLDDEAGNLYGYSIISSYPGDDLKPVADSTRYFILSFVKDNSDLNESDSEELVGMGFSDRKDSADFMWAVVNHMNSQMSTEQSEESSDGQAKGQAEHGASKRKLESNQEEEPAKKVAFQDSVTTDSSHIVIEKGDVETYVTQGLKRPGIFACHLCSANFDDMRHMKSHWHHTHKLRHSAHCVDCHRPFPTLELMVEHRNEVHGYKCPVCKTGFKLDRHLESHYLMEHQKKLEFPCNICEKKFEYRKDLKSHITDVHPNSLVKCPDCPQDMLFTKVELTQHAGAHSKYIFCHLCDSSFVYKGELRTHMETVHEGAEQLKLL